MKKIETDLRNFVEKLLKGKGGTEREDELLTRLVVVRAGVLALTGGPEPFSASKWAAFLGERIDFSDLSREDLETYARDSRNVHHLLFTILSKALDCGDVTEREENILKSQEASCAIIAVGLNVFRQWKSGEAVSNETMISLGKLLGEI